jgi:hypothetical protein
MQGLARSGLRRSFLGRGDVQQERHGVVVPDPAEGFQRGQTDFLLIALDRLERDRSSRRVVNQAQEDGLRLAG